MATDFTTGAAALPRRPHYVLRWCPAILAQALPSFRQQSELHHSTVSCPREVKAPLRGKRGNRNDGLERRFGGAIGHG